MWFVSALSGSQFITFHCIKILVRSVSHIYYPIHYLSVTNRALIESSYYLDEHLKGLHPLPNFYGGGGILVSIWPKLMVNCFCWGSFPLILPFKVFFFSLSTLHFSWIANANSISNTAISFCMGVAVWKQGNHTQSGGVRNCGAGPRVKERKKQICIGGGLWFYDGHITAKKPTCATALSQVGKFCTASFSNCWHIVVLWKLTAQAVGDQKKGLIWSSLF